MQETWVWSLGWEDPLEKGMATYSSILAWRIPWREEPGGLQPMGSQRIRHDRAANTFTVNIPLSGYATVYLSIHLMKDILATFKFRQSWISCYEHLCAGFYGHTFSALLDKYQQHDYLIDKSMSSFVRPAVFGSSCATLPSHRPCVGPSAAPPPR